MHPTPTPDTARAV